MSKLPVTTWSHVCTCGEAIVASTSASGVEVSPAPTHPLGAEHACAATLRSQSASRDPRRLLRPRRREGDRWVETSWDEAMATISAEARQLRKQHGPGALGLAVGPAAATHAATAARVAGAALSWGTPHVYGPLAEGANAAWLRACEAVTGTAWPLQSDVGRAHYVLLLGANATAAGWGPLQQGAAHAAELAFSRKTKSTKLVTADCRRAGLAVGSDVHLAIRPGTELFLVLGMIAAILHNDWRDEQFSDDYCLGLDALREALTPWPLERCAAVCGVPAPDIAGVALKFSRAAMAVAHRSPEALSGEHATLTAWAILVLHALTANLLRPGGLYDAKGAVDLHLAATMLGTAGAPRTASGDALLLGQASFGTLANDLATGRGPRALFCVQADPVGSVPREDAEALGDLDLLVALDTCDTATTRRAHWVLPVAHAWERDDLRVLDGATTPKRALQRTTARCAAPGEARAEDQVVQELTAAVGTPLSRGAWGLHLRATGHLLARADLTDLAARAAALAGFDAAAWSDDTRAMGEIDRATWRVRTDSGKLELLPASIAGALSALTEPVAPAAGEVLLRGAAASSPALHALEREATTTVTLHPDLGHAEGARVRIVRGDAHVLATVALDTSLRPDSIVLPIDEVDGAAGLLTGAPRDRFSRCKAREGLVCRVESA